MRPPVCQSCGKLLSDNAVCTCGSYAHPAGQVSSRQPSAPYPHVGAKPKKQPGKIMIKTVSIINIVLAGIGTIGTIPYAGVSAGQVFEFVILAIILGMSIAGLSMAKDKSKAGLILAFGIATLVLIIASIVIIPEEPLFILFTTQGILYIVGAVKRKKAEV